MAWSLPCARPRRGRERGEGESEVRERDGGAQRRPTHHRGGLAGPGEGGRPRAQRRALRASGARERARDRHGGGGGRRRRRRRGGGGRGGRRWGGGALRRGRGGGGEGRGRRGRGGGGGPEGVRLLLPRGRGCRRRGGVLEGRPTPSPAPAARTALLRVTDSAGCLGGGDGRQQVLQAPAGSGTHARQLGQQRRRRRRRGGKPVIVSLAPFDLHVLLLVVIVGGVVFVVVVDLAVVGGREGRTLVAGRAFPGAFGRDQAHASGTGMYQRRSGLLRRTFPLAFAETGRRQLGDVDRDERPTLVIGERRVHRPLDREAPERRAAWPGTRHRGVWLG